MDDPKESALSRTGRLPSEPEIQFLKGPDLPTYLQEIMELLAKEVTVTTGIDLASRPDSTGAMLIKFVDGHMEVEHLTGIQGQRANLLIIDEYDLVAPDYADLELRTLSAYSQEILNDAINPLVLNGPSLGKQRFQHGFFEVDYDPDEMRRQRMKPDVKRLAKAKKDKSYLALDPTKNHRKRRR